MNRILLDAFKQKPAAALEYFKRKGYDVSWNWFDVWKDAHAKGFTVAKALNADVLRTIRIAVEDAVKNGRTLQEFKTGLMPTIAPEYHEDKKGKLKKNPLHWWGRVKVGDREVQLGSPERLKTIYQTNLQTAYMAGRYKGQKEAAVYVPIWVYISLIDGNTTDKCREMHGRAYRHDDPIWKYMYPPNHWGCRARVVALTETQAARQGITVESSEGRIVEQETIVGRGEAARAVTVKGVQLGNGRTFWAGPGWDYNAAETAWMPEIEKFHPLDARRFVEEGFKGPDYMRFLMAKGKIGGMLPVAVLPEDYMTKIGAKTNVVRMSADTLWKNAAHHPDLNINDYLRIQEVVEGAHMVVQHTKTGEIQAYLGTDSNPLVAVIKMVAGGKELYLQSFRWGRTSQGESLKRNDSTWRIIK